MTYMCVVRAISNTIGGMADSSVASKVSEEDLTKSEELKNKANELFKG